MIAGLRGNMRWCEPRKTPNLNPAQAFSDFGWYLGGPTGRDAKMELRADYRF